MSSRKRALPLLAGAVVALGAGPLADAAPAKGASAQAKPAAQKQAKKAKQRRSAARQVVLSGRGKPSPRLGSIGDVYLRTSDDTLWGPKTRRGWGKPRPIARRGPAGSPGATGRPGATGPAGPTLTPTLGTATVLAEVPEPGRIAGHWDSSTMRLVLDATIELDVELPVGISLVTLLPRGFLGGQVNSPWCELTGPTFELGSSGEGGNAVSGLAVVTRAGTTGHLRCFTSGVFGESREGTVAGTRVLLQPTNVALPPGLA